MVIPFVSLVLQRVPLLAIQKWHLVLRRSVPSSRNSWPRRLKFPPRSSLGVTRSQTILWAALQRSQRLRTKSGPKERSWLVLKPIWGCGHRDVIKETKFQRTQELAMFLQSGRMEQGLAVCGTALSQVASSGGSLYLSLILHFLVFQRKQVYPGIRTGWSTFVCLREDWSGFCWPEWRSGMIFWKTLDFSLLTLRMEASLSSFLSRSWPKKNSRTQTWNRGTSFLGSFLEYVFPRL